MQIELNKIYNMNCIDGMKEMRNNSIELIITSPPYNVGIKYKDWNDEMLIDDYLAFTNQWLKEAYNILKDDGRIAINIPYEINIKERGGRIFLASEYWQIMQKIGFNFAGIVDLEESQSHRVKLTAWGSWLSASAPYIYNPKECIIIAYKKVWKKKRKGKSYFTKFDKKEFQKLVYGQWDYTAESHGKTLANFSLSIPSNVIKILSYKDDVILDPFMGSGTTVEACLHYQRNFIGFEISEEYCKIANKRIDILQRQQRLELFE